eukprot:CAMPEP_0175151800 /NCGR_PEP_ID=MMETSP0087-20121206/18732_1 /TAXON_ID=136419 /ORGANISM="Unknown Unknown, Strain D1" /LENGTH=346 /DNA_ID=CAMNT_0016438107 /DNA_START=15 /DNA_END=1055 /DNA_ORIENTATION=+
MLLRNARRGLQSFPSAFRLAVPSQHVGIAAFSTSPKLDVKLIKKLRDQTGAPMVDCKNALTEAMQQNEAEQMDFAVDWLRKKGKAAAAKKAGRTASEGLVGMGVNADQSYGVVVELNSETDFVAKNELFQKLLTDLVATSLKQDTPTVAGIMAAKSEETAGTVEEHFTDVVTALRENIQLRRISGLRASPEGRIAGYVHSALSSAGNAKLGRIGCLVNIEAVKPEATDSLADFGAKVAMHVAAGYPKYLNPDYVPAEHIKRERDVIMDSVAGTNKPQKVIDMMVEGRVNKYYEDCCLLNQKFLISEDGAKQPAVSVVAEKLGMRVAGFQRFECGQELEGEGAPSDN